MRRIEQADGRALAAPADVTQPEQVDELFARAEEAFGPVMVLVNNAGMRIDGLAPQLDAESWASVLDTNLSAAFHTTRRALRPMLRGRFGRIVNIASIVGPRANAGQSNYAASKAGLIGMTKTVAVEVARRGITVNAVAPGLVETKLSEGIGNGLAEQIPARRPGTPGGGRGVRALPRLRGGGVRDRDRAHRRRRTQRVTQSNERSDRDGNSRSDD